MYWWYPLTRKIKFIHYLYLNLAQTKSNPSKKLIFIYLGYPLEQGCAG